MEIIAVESQAYQELIDKLNRIEQYVERTSRLIQDIDDELEMTTKDLIGTLNISESTLYWKSHTNLTHPGKYFRPSKVKIMRPTSPK